MEKEYLSFEEQNELVKKSIAGDEAATIALINLCYPIARNIASRYILSNADMEDLMQEAMFGVLLAIPRYRSDKGTKFSTYCTFWMQKKMRKFAETNFIKYPETKAIELKKYIRFIQEFMKKHGREPLDKEILEGMDISIEKLRSFQEFPTSYFILDEIDAFISSDEKDVVDLAVLHVLLEDALEFVNENERQVIIYHFGLFSIRSHTFKEIAEILGCSKEWARHLEKTGLRKMKHYFSQIGVEISI